MTRSRGTRPSAPFSTANELRSHSVTWLSLIPAIAVFASILALAVGLQRVRTELVAVRKSLRRTQAAAVAIDDVGRSAERLVARADDLRGSARVRVGLAPNWWTRQRSIGR